MAKGHVAPLLLSIMLVIAASGCVGGGGTTYSASAGVTINKMFFDPTSIFDKDEATDLIIELQNVGAKKLEYGGAYWVYGSGGWTASGDPMEAPLNKDSFLPPDDELGLPGTIEEKIITLTPPNIPDGMDDTYTFYTRVCYPYKTSSLSVLRTFGTDEYRSEPVVGSEAVTRASAGPIHISLDSKTDIPRRGDTLRLAFTITDVGGGFATAEYDGCDKDNDGPNVDSSDRNKALVSVKIDGKVIKDSNNAEICKGDTDNPVILRDGTGTLRCTVHIGKTGLSTDPTAEYHVTAEAKYEYYTTQTSSILVKDSFDD